MTSRDFAFEWRSAHHPLECFSAIERMPHPTRVGRSRTGRARVNAIGICRINSNRLLEPGSADSSNDWMTEGRQIYGLRNVRVHVSAHPDCFVFGRRRADKT